MVIELVHKYYFKCKENSLFGSSDGAFKDGSSTLGNTIIVTVGVLLPVTPSIRLVL
jgi:hypothetical protein